MRQSLQKGVGRLILYFFIGLLVISFAVWGIADFITGQSRQMIATVGDIAISPEEYQRSYQRQIAQYSSQLGRQVTTEEARAAGVPQQILDGLISRAAITERASELGLGISEEAIRLDILEDDSFQDASGAFNRTRFEQLLAANDLSEAAYVEELRGDLIRRQLLGAFTQGAVVPDVMLEAANRYQNEQRVLTYFVIGRDAAGAIEPPSEETLKQFYEDRKDLFTAPEYRRISAVLATPALIRERITVTDEELQQLYRSRIAQYTTPERRQIQQIGFPTREAAEKAAAEIKAGKEFVEAARQAGFQPADIDLGTVAKSDMVDKTIAERAFALQMGEVSGPIEGLFTTALIRVVDIVPGGEKPFEEVRNEVQTLAVDQRVAQELSRVTNAFEDDHTAGMPILEAAKKHNLPVQDVVLDRQGRGRDSNPVKLDGATQALYTSVFASDIGVENEPVRLDGGAYAWFDVQEIIPTRQKPFEEVRDQAAAAWTDEQVRTKLTGIAQDLEKRIDSGEPVATVAQSVNATVSETKPLKRSDVQPGLPISAVAQAFTLPGGGAGTTATPDRLSRVVFQVTKVIEPPALEPAAADTLRSQLGQSIASDNLSQYIAGVRSSLGTSINQREFSRLAGAGAANN